MVSKRATGGAEGEIVAHARELDPSWGQDRATSKPQVRIESFLGEHPQRALAEMGRMTRSPWNFVAAS